MTTSKLADLLARAGWTAAQAGLGVLTVDLGTAIPGTVWWSVPVAAVLSAAKTWVVNHNKA